MSIMQMFFHLVPPHLQKLTNGKLAVFSLSEGGGGYKWLVLTPTVVGKPRQARRCSSSAAEFHAAPKKKHQHPWQRGKSSGLSSPPLTASAGTVRAASETGPETRRPPINQSLTG